MATEDIIALGLAERLRKKLNEVEAELRDVTDAYNRGTVHSARYNEVSKQLTATQARLQRELAAAASQTVQIATTAKAAGGVMGRELHAGSSRAGMGFLLLSQAIEDSQYGLNAIVNNIPGIVMAMGGSGGLAGAASIAAVGVSQLTRHWESLADTIVRSMPQLKGAVELINKISGRYAGNPFTQGPQIGQERIGAMGTVSANAFQLAVKQSGGSDTVQNTLAEMTAKGKNLDAEGIKRNREKIARLFSEAVSGDESAAEWLAGIMGGDFATRFKKASDDELAARYKAVAKAFADIENSLLEAIAQVEREIEEAKRQEAERLRDIRANRGQRMFDVQFNEMKRQAELRAGPTANFMMQMEMASRMGPRSLIGARDERGVEIKNAAQARAFQRRVDTTEEQDAIIQDQMIRRLVRTPGRFYKNEADARTFAGLTVAAGRNQIEAMGEQVAIENNKLIDTNNRALFDLANKLRGGFPARVR